jgi:serine/threonine-protein kinase RIO1
MNINRFFEKQGIKVLDASHVIEKITTTGGDKTTK